MKNLLGKIAIPVVIALVLFGAYFYFFSGSAAPDSGSLVVTGNSGQNDEILQLLLKLKSLPFDTSVFQTPTFLSLRDFGQTIPSQPKGRPNPFAPIGIDGVSAQAQLQSQADASAGQSSAAPSGKSQSAAVVNSAPASSQPSPVVSPAPADSSAQDNSFQGQ